MRISSEETKLQKLNYSGKLQDYQLNGNRKKRYMSYEKDPYNNYQNFLYKRALYGLSVYTKEEIKVMHWEKKRRIEAVHEKAQKVLNLWKQEIVNELSTYLFRTFFPKCEYAKCLLENTETDPLYINDLTFKELKITKEQIIDKLIEFKVLPVTFRTLKNQPINN